MLYQNVMVIFFLKQRQTQCITHTTKGCTCNDRYPSPIDIDTRGLIPDPIRII